MVSAQILHAADLHLGAPLAALGDRVGPEASKRLRERSRLALERLVNAALDHEVSAVVLAGDVYDQAEREVSAQVRLATQLGRLHEAGIPVFIAHGNHDPLVSAYRPAAALPPSVTVFGPGEVQVHHLGLRDGTSAVVAGISFGVTHEKRNLALEFHTVDTGGERCVAVLHANVDSTVGHDPYAPCSVDDLRRAAAVHYWALGHVHQRIAEQLEPSRWWAYSGNLQGRSAKPAECGPKGALVVPFTDTGVAEPRFVACDAVRFERLEVDVSAAGDVGEALDLCAEAVTGVTRADESVAVVFRIALVGATAAHSQLNSGADLLELLREHAEADIGEGALMKVVVDTRPAIERARLLERNDLLAALLRELDAIAAGSCDEWVRAGADELLPSGAAGQRFGSLLDRDPALAALILADVERRIIDGFGVDR